MISFWETFDNTILNYIQAQMHTTLLDKIIPCFSKSTDYGIIWIAIALVLILTKKYRRTGVTLLIVLVVCTLVGEYTLKPLIARMRPCMLHPEVTLLVLRPTDFSFPSAHTMSSFGAATTLCLLTNKRLAALGFVLAACVAFTRLYLYLHYPSDVIAGIVLGVFFAVVVVRIASSWVDKKNYNRRRKSYQ